MWGFGFAFAGADRREIVGIHALALHAFEVMRHVLVRCGLTSDGSRNSLQVQPPARPALVRPAGPVVPVASALEKH